MAAITPTKSSQSTGDVEIWTATLNPVTSDTVSLIPSIRFDKVTFSFLVDVAGGTSVTTEAQVSDDGTNKTTKSALGAKTTNGNYQYELDMSNTGTNTRHRFVGVTSSASSAPGSSVVVTIVLAQALR